MPTLTLEAKFLGRKKPVFGDWTIELSSKEATPPICLRDLLTRIVRQEVAAFEERQAERRLARVLSGAQIEQAAQAGKVEMGGVKPGTPIDAEAAVSTALQAFADGLYFVFVDGTQYTELDGEVLLGTDSRLTFIRLTPLAGG